jgi:predicted N-acetyltransferase YhbS
MNLSFMPSTKSHIDWMLVHMDEAAITSEDDRKLRRLLRTSFPYEPALLTRRFVKQPPAERWMVMDGGGEFIAHAALHEKMIGTEEGDISVGGVAEICVAADHRGCGLVKQMLQSIHDKLGMRGVPFAMLFGQPKIYKSSGYAVISNPLRADNSLARHWNPFCGKPMIHQLSVREWPDGVIDLRGPTF